MTEKRSILKLRTRELKIGDFLVGRFFQAKNLTTDLCRDAARSENNVGANVLGGGRREVRAGQKYG